MHIYQNTKLHISAITLQHTEVLYHTVTAENAAKHIVASIIRNWPHREIFSASSSCRIRLWVKGTSAVKMLLFLEDFSIFS